jgi:hypothetical protein
MGKRVEEEFAFHPLAKEAPELCPDDMAGRIAGLQSEIPHVLAMYAMRLEAQRRQHRARCSPCPRML